MPARSQSARSQPARSQPARSATPPAPSRRRASAPQPLPGGAIRSGEVWRDTAGRPIEAHGGGLLAHEGRWWWYGEDHHHGLGNATGIHAYSSDDLVRWRDEGVALPAAALPEQYRAQGACERPKVLSHAGTRRFVMWMHLDGGQGYTHAEAGIAVADHPAGPFTLLRRGRPIPHDLGLAQDDRCGQRSRGPTYRDMALFQDQDGTGYVFYAAEDNKTMYVARLSADYTWVEEPIVQGRTWNRILVGLEREAPAPFRIGDRYHLLSSGCTGWAPNPALHAVADHPLGPWRVLGDPCRGHDAGTTYRSQPTYVLPVGGRDAIYLADRWVGHDLARSSYVWLPLRVRDDDTLALDWYDHWDARVFARDPRRLLAPRVRRQGDQLRWAAVPGASGYRIYRNAEHLGSTAGTSWTLPPLLAPRAAAVTVVATTLGGVWSAPSTPLVVPAGPARRQSLSAFPADAWTQGYGLLRYDASLVQEPIVIGGRPCRHGLGTHAPSRIVYRLGGAYGRLTTWVGLTPTGKAPVRALIRGDGRVLAASGLLAPGAAAERLAANLSQVQELELLLEPGPDGHDWTHCAWGDPVLSPPATPRR